MPEQEHYFTSKPAQERELKPLRVHLADRDVTVQVAGGVFSPGALDRGTAVLLAEVPPPEGDGTFLDLGCGWGPIALTLALRCPEAAVYAVDVNERALDLTARNAAALGLSRVRASLPDEVPPETTFDLIWSNPPIRVGKDALHALLAQWLPRLAPAGAAYLVVQKNLGGDTLQRWVSAELGMPCERHATSKGFRVLRVTHPDAG